MEDYWVKWHGSVVGSIKNGRFDMWYLEGNWFPEAGPKTEAFLKAVASLDPKMCVSGKQRGIVVYLLKDQNFGAEPMLALVLGPPAEMLFLRVIFDKQAQEVARKWELEELETEKGNE